MCFDFRVFLQMLSQIIKTYSRDWNLTQLNVVKEATLHNDFRNFKYFTTNNFIWPYLFAWDQEFSCFFTCREHSPANTVNGKKKKLQCKITSTTYHFGFTVNR